MINLLFSASSFVHGSLTRYNTEKTANPTAVLPANYGATDKLINLNTG